MITAEFLPKNEQALRGREQLRGEAELEIADEKYNKEDGTQQLLNDLEESFGEKPLFRQGGVIREYESIGRLQGEHHSLREALSFVGAKAGGQQCSNLP